MQDKRHLITVGKLGTAIALRPDFTRQVHFIYLGEAVSFKESRMIGQAEDGVNAEFACLLEAGSYQLVAETLMLVILSHGEGFYFGKVLPADMQRRTADYPVAVPDNEEIPDIFVELTQGASQHLTSTGKMVHQLVYLGYILYTGFLYVGHAAAFPFNFSSREP